MTKHINFDVETEIKIKEIADSLKLSEVSVIKMAVSFFLSRIDEAVPFITKG